MKRILFLLMLMFFVEGQAKFSASMKNAHIYSGQDVELNLKSIKNVNERELISFYKEQFKNLSDDERKSVKQKIMDDVFQSQDKVSRFQNEIRLKALKELEQESNSLNTP